MSQEADDFKAKRDKRLEEILLPECHLKGKDLEQYIKNYHDTTEELIKMQFPEPSEDDDELDDANTFMQAAFSNLSQAGAPVSSIQVGNTTYTNDDDDDGDDDDDDDVFTSDNPLDYVYDVWEDTVTGEYGFTIFSKDFWYENDCVDDRHANAPFLEQAGFDNMSESDYENHTLSKADAIQKLNDLGVSKVTVH